MSNKNNLELNFLKILEQDLNKVDGLQEYALSDLLNSDYLSETSKFSNYDEFQEAILNAFNKKLEDLDENQLNEFVHNNFDFETWDDLIFDAGQLILINKLDID